MYTNDSICYPINHPGKLFIPSDKWKKIVPLNNIAFYIWYGYIFLPRKIPQTSYSDSYPLPNAKCKKLAVR